MLKKKKSVNDFERSANTYFSEISKFLPLTREEETALWRRYKKNHDLDARNKLVTSNLKFVASVAKNYIGMGLSYSDLIAEGNCGLMKAMDRFDYERGYKTISYSVWWIRQSILDALQNRKGIDGDPLPEDYEPEIADDDICGETESEGAKNLQIISDSHQLTEESRALIGGLIESLDDRERVIITEYFGIGMNKPLTLEEIGEEMNLTKERVRQLKERALKKLRAEALRSSVFSEVSPE